MNAKTLKALKESIQSWKTREIRKYTDIMSEHCALCHLFLFKSHCVGCPIYETVDGGCKNTVWRKLFSYLHNTALTKLDPKIIEQYRKEEVDFLISLLPEGETI